LFKTDSSEFGFVFAGVAHPHAEAWAAAIQDVAGAELVGAFDTQPERALTFVDNYGGKRYHRTSEFKEPEVQAAIINGRNDELADLALAVLREDRPVLLEKPGGMHAADLERVEAQARNGGQVVQMGYFLRYSDTVIETKRLLDRGQIGTVSLGRFHSAMPRLAWEEMGDWFRDPENIVGVFQEDACHVVDIVLHLFGQPRAVTAQRVFGSFEGGMGEDALIAILDYGTHLISVDFTAWEANPWVENWGYEIYGTDATIRAGLTPAWMELFSEGGSWRSVGVEKPTERTSLEEQLVADRQTCLTRALEAFVRAIREGDPAPVDASAGLSVFRVIEAIYESARRETKVKVAL
jgi:predicted dehydrogenase